MTTVNAYAANEAGGKLKPFKFDLFFNHLTKTL